MWCPTQPIDVFIKVANETAAPEPGIFLAGLVSVAGEIMSQQSLPTLGLSSGSHVEQTTRCSLWSDQTHAHTHRAHSHLVTSANNKVSSGPGHRLAEIVGQSQLSTFNHGQL